MRSREVKKLVMLSRTLERENADLKDRLQAMHHVEERRYPFNHLEIIVRPSRQVYLVQDGLMDLDLRVIGTDDMPTVCNYKTVSLSTFDVLRENAADFIKGIGEVMAAEQMAHGKEHST